MRMLMNNLDPEVAERPADTHVSRHRLAWARQLFQQRMTDERGPRVLPCRAVGDEKGVPVMATQRIDERRRCLQECAVLVEQGQPVTQGTA